MNSYFNDSPIERSEDDRYGVTPFAEALAKSILNVEKPVGTTIALHGPWGSGKSSVANLVRTALAEENDKRLVVTELKCWWYRGEEALALAFLQNLNAVLRTTLKDKVEDLVPKLGRGLLQAGPIVGSAMALTPAGGFSSLIGRTFNFAKRFFPDGDTLEGTFQKLSEILETENRRFLVVIDDIDRLSPEEAIAIFRLVKSVGRLPNVMYLLIFDRRLAENAVQERYPSEGPHFLEKIIQAGFELPPPLPTDLNDAVLSSMSEICELPDEDQAVRFMNIFYDVVAPYITSPRHVNRLLNAINITWPAIANDVSVADFIALETLRLYEPSLFNSIKANKDRLCGTGRNGDAGRPDDDRFAVFLAGVPEQRHELARTALQRLFPGLENIGYSSEWVAEWSSERRICVETHFDTYFRLSLSEEVLSSQEIENLIEHADDHTFIQAALRQAAKTERRGGTSMVPVYLDELTTNAKRVPKEKVESFIGALFKVHDEIDQERDGERGFMAIANTSLRCHWLIRRLTRDRFSIEERTKMYLATTTDAPLGWLVDFVFSARRDYKERDNKPATRQEDCLVSQDALPKLTNRALDAIRVAANNGDLLCHQDLLFILHCWADFMEGNPSEVKDWTSSLLNDTDSIVTLARAMTGTSWSMGMGGFGGLGDRVAKPSIRAEISDGTEIVDITNFRNALERVRDVDDVSVDKRRDVQQFLDAWDRQRQSGDL